MINMDSNGNQQLTLLPIQRRVLEWTATMATVSSNGILRYKQKQLCSRTRKQLTSEPENVQAVHLHLEQHTVINAPNLANQQQTAATTQSLHDPRNLYNKQLESQQPTVMPIDSL